MLYSSLLTIPDMEDYVRKRIKTSKDDFTEYKVAFGLIGRGEGDSIIPLTYLEN